MDSPKEDPAYEMPLTSKRPYKFGPISRGASVWALSALTTFAPFAEQNDGAAGMDLSTGDNRS
jgi:hypothetical protein